LKKGKTTISISNAAGLKASCVVTVEGDNDIEAPTKPEGLKVSDVEKTSVTITWKASKDNVQVTGYKIYVDGIFLQEVDEETLGVVIENLDQGTSYIVGVSAVDAEGNESEISNIQVKTKSDKPSNPSEPSDPTKPSKPTKPSDSKKPTVVPVTGDRALPGALVMVVTVAGVAVVSVLQKKRGN